MSSPNPVDVVANVATGGLYGAGEALAQGRPGSALENLGPFGSAVHPISPQAADIGNLVGAGAGIGGGLASGTTGIGAPGGFGTAAAQSPYYAGVGPEGLPMLADPSTGFVAQNVAINPVTGAAGPGAGITAAGIPGLAASAGVAGGTSGLGAAAGAGIGQQLANFLGGMSPLSLPSLGATPSAGGQQQLTAQQKAALLSALQSEAHRGLAPRFEARMAGQQESPGIAALRGIAGGPQ